MEMHYATLLEAMADELGSADAIVFGDKRLSWSELDDRAARLAQVMLDAGIEPGDRVGLFLYNCSEYMEAMLAALKIRAVPININYRYTGAELRYLLDDSGATGLIFHASLHDPVTAALDLGTRPKLLLGIDDGSDTPAEIRDYETALDQATPAARVTRQESDTFMLYTGGSALLPVGYFGDPEKTAKTFREIDGKRYGFTGDMGILEDDNTLVFLGRGSGCINTGGEKVYPEEVEEVIKTHLDIEDGLVVGVDDPRFGQRVAAVLAGYKAPRTVVAATHIARGPNGKPDYRWAREIITQSTQ